VFASRSAGLHLSLAPQAQLLLRHPAKNTTAVVCLQ
jgi:hypothetical protein